MPPDKVPELSSVVPSMKFTVPVAVEGVTVAVKVTELPYVEVLGGLDDMLVDVATGVASCSLATWLRVVPPIVLKPPTAITPVPDGYVYNALIVPSAFGLKVVSGVPLEFKRAILLRAAPPIAVKVPAVMRLSLASKARAYTGPFAFGL